MEAKKQAVKVERPSSTGRKSPYNRSERSPTNRVQLIEPINVAPGKIIQDVKDRIRHLDRSTEDLRKTIEQMDSYNLKKRQKITLIQKQNQKGVSDEQELYRDLATYESYFGEKDHERVGLALVSIQRRIKAS